MRTETVEINGKKIKVQEKRTRELQAMVEQFKEELFAVEMGENAHTAISNGVQFIKSKLTVLFPELTEDDLLDAYPSETEALIEAFIKVNFTGIRKVWATTLQISNLLLKAASIPPKS